ncbi:MAG: DUF1641 domain-containing protein [Acidithiobacillus ferrivorans]
MAAQPEETFIPGLTPEQWAGLARLGDLANGAEQFMGSKAGVIPMELALRAGDWNERFDLDSGIEEVLETIKVLRTTGVLRLVRENAALVTETLQLLAPLVPQILEAVRHIPGANLVKGMQMLGELLPRLDAVLAFLKGPAGNALVAKVKDLGDLWQETSADTTIAEALRLLKQLQEDGNLQRVADLSRQVGLFAETIDLENLLGQLIQQNKDSPLLNTFIGLLHNGPLIARALTDAVEHEAKGQAGGLSGLYRLLKDPDVQRSIRVVAILPVYLEKVGILSKAGTK